MYTRPELDRLICEKLLGMEECDQWRPVWYKDKGAALLKHCQHPDNQCYSKIELNTIIGRLGGPPQYCGSSRAGLMLLRELQKRADTVILYSSRGSGWSVVLRRHYIEGVILSEKIVAGPCIGPTPEMAIALAAVELAGIHISMDDISE